RFISFKEVHQTLAIFTLFDISARQDLLTPLNRHQLEQSMDQIESKGIVESTTEDAPVFVHRSLAEFLAANVLWQKLNSDPNKNIFILLLTEILQRPQFCGIRKFLNNFLKINQVS